MPGLRDGTLPDPQAIARRNTSVRPSTLRRGSGQVPLRAATSRQLALALARVALDAKAEEVVVLDLRKISSGFDFFVICSAESERRMKTIAEEVEERLSDHRTKIRHREGEPEGGWVLIDCGWVVLHIFSPDVRRFYRLERLWADAPRLSIRHPVDA